MTIRALPTALAAVVVLAVSVAPVAVAGAVRPIAAPPAAASSAADLEALVGGNTAFAVDLYRVLAKEPGNLFCSPLSISTALAMTYAGARTATEIEMAAALRFALPQERLHGAFAELDRRMSAVQARDRFTLRAANGLWLQTRFPFLESYLGLVKADYGAELRAADFVGAAEAARREINAWTQERTDGRIRDLVPAGALNPSTVLVLVNAIYFKAAWEDQFETGATVDAPFRVSPERDAVVPMMNRTGALAYRENELAQVVELPYGGGGMSMVVVLPRAPDGLAELEAALTAEWLEEWTSGLGERRVALSLPRFRVERGFSLNRALGSLGMRRAFGDADFSGMVEGGGVFVSEVLHKAFVDVDERGTEAAAATAVVGMMLSMAWDAPETPVVFRADHPFLFLIRDRATGSILFMGRVADPATGGTE
jgi:serpin B